MAAIANWNGDKAIGVKNSPTRRGDSRANYKRDKRTALPMGSLGSYLCTCSSSSNNDASSAKCQSCKHLQIDFLLPQHEEHINIYIYIYHVYTISIYPYLLYTYIFRRYLHMNCAQNRNGTCTHAHTHAQTERQTVNCMRLMHSIANFGTII